MEDMRACSVCGGSFPPAMMAKTTGRYCKPCWAKDQRERYKIQSPDADFRAKNAAKMRAWRAANPGYRKKVKTGTRIRHADLVQTPETKECSACHRVLPRDAFYKGTHGWRANCRECHAAGRRTKYQSDPAERERSLARTKAWMKANPERAKALKRKSTSGWVPERFEAAWEAQRGICPICERPMRREKGQDCGHADHDHETMAPRGILTHNCNIGLGCFEDDPVRLVRTIRYLADHGRAIEPDVDGIPVTLPI